MAFTANEVLIKAAAIDGDDLSKLATLKGEIAGKLGRLLVQEYRMDKVVLTFKTFDKLKDHAKLKDKTALTWSVKASKDASAVLFCVQSNKKDVVSVELLGGLDKVDTGAMVVNLVPGDRVIDPASKKQAEGFNGPGSEAKTPTSKLTGINLKRKIVLCGHGGGPDVKGDALYTADEFGKLSADGIIKFLIKKGLAPAYDGTIYLSGCHTAAGYGDPKSFAAQVHKGFAKKGYDLLSVAGTPGEAWTHDDGSKGAVPSAVSENLKLTTKKCEELIKKLDKALKSGIKDQSLAMGKLEKLTRSVADAKDVIKETPTEGQAALTEKLLNPLIGKRAEMHKAVESMTQSNLTLQRAIKSEQAYLVKLKEIAKLKGDLQSGRMSESDFNREEENLFAVEDWWGVFGPARATVLKVEQEAKSSGSILDKFMAKFKKKEKAK